MAKWQPDVLDDGSMVFAASDVLSSHDVEVARLDSEGQVQWIREYRSGYLPAASEDIR